MQEIKDLKIKDKKNSTEIQILRSKLSQNINTISNPEKIEGFS